MICGGPDGSTNACTLPLPGAPSSAMWPDPSTPTAVPSSSPAAESDATNVPLLLHEVPARTNAYPAPRNPLCAGKPSNAVAPSADNPRSAPSMSLAKPSGAVSSCCSDHTDPSRVNTYPAPCRAAVPTVWSGAPISAVSPAPESATAAPNVSPVALSLALSFACRDQLPALLENTYTEPVPAPVASGSDCVGAPTSAVSPDTDSDTDAPKLSS